MFDGSTYRRLAPEYDRWVGGPYFAGLRDAFRWLVKEYDLRFASAADLGCGTGLFACYLARTWRVPVVGVDLSEDMLRRARARCPGVVRFLRQDLRDLSLPRPVDLATANFDTLNHLTRPADLRRALRRVASNLAPGGHFVFDFLTPCLGTLPPRTCRAGPAGTMCQRIRWITPGALFATHIRLPRAARGGPLRVRQLERAYTVSTMTTALRDAGFRVRGLHEADTLRPLRSCAPRVVVVARRQPTGG